jgi:putative ABC transport system permease protein
MPMTCTNMDWANMDWANIDWANIDWANIDWAWRIRTVTVAASGATMGARSSPSVKLLHALFHDRSSLIVARVGIAFLVVLVAAQFGLRLAWQNRIVGMLGTQADPWVVPPGTKSFDEPSLLPGHAKRAIFSRGVAGMEELAMGFAAGRELSGGAKAPLLVASGAHSNRSLPWDVRSLPWDIIAGSLTELTSPNAVAVDSTYFEELGILAVGTDLFAAISAVKRTHNDPAVVLRS